MQKLHLLSLTILFAFGCRKADNLAPNKPPIANAGSDVNIESGSKVIVDGSNFITVETNEQNQLSFTDKNVKAGTLYEYQIRVFFSDGKKSALGKIVKLKI